MLSIQRIISLREVNEHLGDKTETVKRYAQYILYNKIGTYLTFIFVVLKFSETINTKLSNV